jgi:hypothetical protein
MCTACSGGKVLRLGDIEGVVLTEAEAQELLKPCSRSAPDPADGMWNPTVKDIGPLEQALPSYVTAHPPTSEGIGPVRQLEKYKRQYVGLSRGGRRYIYVSLMLYGSNMDDLDWKSKAVQICDGGATAFGVEYDLQSESFTHIAYNGAG